VLVAENAPEALFLAARNVPYLHIVDVAALDPVSLVGADKVVMTVESLKRIEEWLA
jgi:large subunit ribosomal protein L4